MLKLPVTILCFIIFPHINGVLFWMTHTINSPLNPSICISHAYRAPHSCARSYACDEKWRLPFIIAVLLIVAYYVGSSACILLKGNQFILCKLHPSSIENLSLVRVRKAQSVIADLKMAWHCINQACPTPGAMQQMSRIVINSIIHTYCFPPLNRLNSAVANRPLLSEALWMFQREVERGLLSSRCR